MLKILSVVCLYDQVKKYENSLINSVLTQTVSNDILVIDDYNKLCTDKYSFNLNIIKNSNMNISEIRELCIEYALKNKYTYIAFFDSDDIYCSNRLEKCINKMIKDKTDICTHNMKIVDINGSVIHDDFLDKKMKYLDDLDKNILKYNFIGLGNSIFRVEMLSNIPKCPKGVIFDWWLAVHLIIIKGCRCSIEYERLSTYRQSTDNIANIITINHDNLKKELLYKLKLYYCLLDNDSFIVYEDIIIDLIRNICEKYREIDTAKMSFQNCWWNYLN